MQHGDVLHPDCAKQSSNGDMNMGELTQFINRAKNGLGLHVQKNPAGTYSFVGSVPLVLSKEGPAEDIQTGLRFGFGLVSKTVKSRTWPTAQAAWDEAESLGYKRCAAPGCDCANQ